MFNQLLVDMRHIPILRINIHDLFDWLYLLAQSIQAEGEIAKNPHPRFKDKHLHMIPLPPSFNHITCIAVFQGLVLFNFLFYFQMERNDILFGMIRYVLLLF